jgi:hypothetical protein
VTSMAARFQVKHAFVIEKRHLFVLVGSPLEGTISPGMTAAVPVSATLSIAIPIQEVEIVRRGGGESVALTSPYTRPAEVDLLRGLDLAGTVLDLTDDGEAEAAADAAPPSASVLPVVCSLSPSALSERREDALRGLRARAREIREIAGGWSIRFAAEDDLIAELAHFIQKERKCCAFLRFALIVAPGEGPVWLELTGPDGTQDMLRGLMELAPHSPRERSEELVEGRLP